MAILFVSSSCSVQAPVDALNGARAGLMEAGQDTPDSVKARLLKKTNLTKKQFMEEFVSSVNFEKWKIKYPGQLAEAILHFPEEKISYYLNEVFLLWGGLDYDNSSKFITDHLAPGPIQDSAIEGLVESIKSKDLAVAVSWAHEITDLGRRYSLLESLATH